MILVHLHRLVAESPRVASDWDSYKAAADRDPASPKSGLLCFTNTIPVQSVLQLLKNGLEVSR